MLAILWIHNDCEEALAWTRVPTLTQQDRIKIDKIYNISKNILERTTLQDLRFGVEELSHLQLDHPSIRKLIEKVRRRQENGQIQQYSYHELLGWIDVFMYFNTQKFLGLPNVIRMDVKETVDKMFEYWNN